MGKMDSLGKMKKSINVAVYGKIKSISCLFGCKFTWSNVSYVLNKSTSLEALNGFTLLFFQNRFKFGANMNSFCIQRKTLQPSTFY